MQRALFVVAIASVIALPVSAQQKPTVAAADYAKWETLGNDAVVSPNGNVVAYTVHHGNGRNDLHYRQVDGAEQVIVSGAQPQISSDNKWLALVVSADTGQGGGGGARGGRGGRGGGAAPATASSGGPRSKVEIIDLATGATTTYDDARSFSFSHDGSHIAMRRPATAGRRASDVIVRDLTSGTDLTIGNVAELAWSDDGSQLALLIDAEGSAGNGVQLLDARSGALRPLAASNDRYAGLAWRAHALDLAVFRGHGDSAFTDTAYTLVAWTNVGAERATPHEVSSDKLGSGVPMRIAAYRVPRWSEDGSTIFFGVAAREPRPQPERRTADALPPVRVQVWHAKDVREFHQQEVNATQDRERTLLAAWHVGSANAPVRLTDDLTETMQISERGNVVLATTEAPYAAEYMSGRAVRDAYLVDPATGKRTLIVSKAHFDPIVSPSGRYALYEQGEQWWAFDATNGARTNVTGSIHSSFVNTADDHPVPEHGAYGLAGFTTGEKSVIVYDRFDLWNVGLDGSNAARLTRGREDSTQYRCAEETNDDGYGPRGQPSGDYRNGDPIPCQPGSEERTIDPARPIMLLGIAQQTKQMGYARVTIGQGVQPIVWGNESVGALRKAARADEYMFRKQTFAQSPNIFVLRTTSSQPQRLSNTNAFQSEYAWGRQVLMNYTNRRGDPLRMMLTYPANYQPGQKYPMVVYYYEELSSHLHQYIVPNYRNPYNTQVFSQNGYFVLRPDIVFQARNPGYSGLDCVESAVRAVLSRVADIDPKRVGNMGHSWGGYQSAFYAVHNHGTFAATIAGAPLTDLVSFYGYTSGNTGLPESGHFETSQERMQVSLWEDPQAFIRNSTVFSMDSLHTPLLLEEGDADGNVNPFQSQEVYNFGRRLGKDVVYLVYEGENHNVARPESQADYLQRQLEWFGHYLKGEPAARWITSGETYADRQRILKAGNGPAAQPMQAGSAVRPNRGPR